MTEKKIRTDWVYDLETYPNVFTFCAVYSTGKGLRVFEISDRKNDTEVMIEFLRNVVANGHRMVGFNNIGFDYPIVHYIIEKARAAKKADKQVKFTAKELYKVAQEIIESMRGDDRFGKQIKESEVIIPQVDLYKIWHFDNKAKATSLKTLEFNMRSDNIEDLPFKVGTVLTADQIDTLIQYNKHDVLETLKFYRYSEEALQLREDLTGLYGFDCTNFNDTKIGKELFIRSIEQVAPGSCYRQTEHGRKINQTKREVIHLKNCLFPYIKFNRPEFKAVLDWFKRQTITETKGAFSDIPEHELGDLAKYAEMLVKKKKFKAKPTEQELAEFYKEYPLGWIEEEELKSVEYVLDENGEYIIDYPTNEFGVITSKRGKRRTKPKVSYRGCWRVAENMNVVINGFRYDYGLGGLHGAKSGIIEAKEDEVLITQDVASYYPNMAIANNVYPEHLGMTFCKVYKDLYEQRKSHPKGSAANSALKLALNGVYGDSGNEYSPLYDPQYTMSITVGGQMTLCMLIERLIDECNAEIVMCNTDGFEFIVKKGMQQKSNEIIKEWEQLTGLQMEGDVYAKMWVANVNNYISLTTSGKVKLKGAFEHADFKKLGWHKNHSSMVIPKAVEAYFVKGQDYEEFIRLHRDKYDFMLRTKVPRSSRLVLRLEDEEDQPLQNICRYYPVKSGGGKLIKIMPELDEGSGEREIGIDTEWNVKVCNNIANFSWDDLDYNYFVTEAKKLIDSVEQPCYTACIDEEKESTNES